MRALVALLATTILIAPVQARWDVMVTDRGNIRSAMIIGMSESEPSQQFGVICSTLDGKITGEPTITLALPATGKFAVRPGDHATVDISVGDQSWSLPASVEANGTSGFSARVMSDDGFGIIRAAGEMSIILTASDIRAEMLIGAENAGLASQQFRDACGA